VQLIIHFLTKSATLRSCIISVDSSKSNLNVALTLLVDCPDGRITIVFEIADLSKNMGRIFRKNEAK